MKLFSLFGAIWLATACAGPPSPAPPHEVRPLTAAQASEYKLETSFYSKATMAQSILIASSKNVPDVAHREAAYLFDRILSTIDPAVAQKVRDAKVLCVLLGHDELTSDVPQFASDKTGKELDFYNWRQRGFLTRREGRSIFLFPEEDVLEYEGGQQRESILIHELAHVIQAAGFDRSHQDELKAAFEAAKKRGIWNDGRAAQRFRRVTSEKPVSLLDALKRSFPAESPELLRKCLDGGDILVNGKPAHAAVRVTKADKVLIVFGGPKRCYALRNRAEYWAEGLQCWYDTNRTMDHDHNHIRTREQLKEYDPALAALCAKVLGDKPWRFVSPRNRAGKDHLKTFDPAATPKKVDPEHIRIAALDYYDKYWKSFWKRLYDKHGIPGR